MASGARVCRDAGEVAGAFDHFGSDRYAGEELVAEMTSSILCAETEIDNQERFDNSAAYVAGWLSALNHDRTAAYTQGINTARRRSTRWTIGG